MDDQAKRLTIFMVGILIVWTVRVSLFDIVDHQFPTTWHRIGVSKFLQIVLLLLPPVLYVKFVDRENALDALALSRPSVPWVVCTLGACVAWQLGALWVGADEVGDKALRSFAAAVAFPPIIEEILTCGFVLNKARRFISFRWANVIAALFFVAVHVPSWLMIDGMGLAALAKSSLWIFCFGLAMGYLLKVSKTLWVPVIVHAGNNFVSAV